MSEYKVFFEREGKTVTVKEGVTVLQAAIDERGKTYFRLGRILGHAIQFLEVEKARGLLQRRGEEQEGCQDKQYDVYAVFHFFGMKLTCKNSKLFGIMPKLRNFAA